MSTGQETFFIFTECPVCKNTHFDPYRKPTFDSQTFGPDHVKITDSEYGKIWSLSRCLECGHIFANPCPGIDFVNSLYFSSEDPLYDGEAEGRAQNFQRILSCLEKIQPQKGSLLDVGAATGILLDLARKRGWDPDGVEPSQWAVDTAGKKYGIQIRLGSFETSDLKTGYYSSVTMIDFIEHIPAPLDAVKKAYKILAPEGVLVLVTPNIKSIAARLAGSRWWHFRPAHLAYFTRSSLLRLFKEAGFECEIIRSYTWTFSAHYLISRKKILHFLLKNPRLASFWKKIPIKLALGDSFEIYARKPRKA